ncbi:MAG: complex I NDUFA9 subunit family protein [Azovibrio sp.]|uniref:complex I NDUFA9 subunit family protein n=1 Tax=Azovibrio sp. TaxID=1872673 RepID=UPI003C71CF4A
MEQKKVLLLGGSGFVGTYIANRLSEQGAKLTIPTRHRDRNKNLIMLPGVDMPAADINDPAQLEALVRGQDAVINLVGILHSRDVKLPYSRDFEQAHVTLPKQIVATMKATGVRRLVHMSALKADVNGPSEYLRSKGEGEKIVLAAQGELDVTVFCPSVIFGQGDSFLNLFARLLKSFPIFPLGMSQARFQPVWVADVADAVVDCLDNPDTFGQVYELVGPRTYSLQELVQYVARLCKCRTRILPISEGWAYLLAGLLWLSPRPSMSPDNLRSLQVDNVADGSGQTPPGWRPTALEAIAPTYIAGDSPKQRLDRYRWYAGR